MVFNNGFTETGFYDLDGLRYFLQILPYGDKRILHKFKMNSLEGWTPVTKEEEKRIILTKSVVKK